MPRKIRQLIANLERAEFGNCGGKSSHRKFEYQIGVNVTISGVLGEDAKHY